MSVPVRTETRLGELAAVRRQLESMVHSRLLVPFSEQDEQRYRELTAREKDLLNGSSRTE